MANGMETICTGLIIIKTMKRLNEMYKLIDILVLGTLLEEMKEHLI